MLKTYLSECSAATWLAEYSFTAASLSCCGTTEINAWAPLWLLHQFVAAQPTGRDGPILGSSPKAFFHNLLNLIDISPHP